MTDEVYEMLNEPKQIRSQIRMVNDEIEALELSMLPGCIRYDKDKVQVSPEDPMAKFAEKLDDLETKRSILREKYLTAHNRVVMAAEKLAPDEGEVIVMRYLLGLRIAAIAKDLGKSERKVQYDLRGAEEKITFCT